MAEKWESYQTSYGIQRVRVQRGVDRGNSPIYDDIPRNPEDCQMISACPQLVEAIQASISLINEHCICGPEFDALLNMQMDALEKAIEKPTKD